MITRTSIKTSLLRTKQFVSNSFLNRYCQLIFCNLDTAPQTGKTQRHHVIPVCCYPQTDSKERRKQANQDPNNFQVNLQFQDHILAHYYLLKCCSTDLFHSLFHALDKQLKGDSNHKHKRTTQEIRQLITALQLDGYQALYEQAKALEFKPVICIETQQVFHSIAEASSWVGIRICRHQLTSPHKCVGGYHWAYSTDKVKQKQLESFVGKSPRSQLSVNLKPVICIETQQVYSSSREVDALFGLTYGNTAAAIRNQRVFRGCHWAYLSDLEQQEHYRAFVNKAPETAGERKVRLLQNRTKPHYTAQYREMISERSSKKIICIETQRVYKSLTAAAKELRALGATPGGLSSAASGFQETCAGYHWALLQDEVRQEQLKNFIGKPQDPRPSNKKAAETAKQNRIDRGDSQVICVETQRVFDTTTQASEWAGGSVVGALYSRGYSRGYHWAYLKDTQTQESLKSFIGKPRLKERPATIHNQRAVKCLETGEIFPSILKASIAKQCSVSSITNSASEQTKNPRGLHWVYWDNPKD